METMENLGEHIKTCEKCKLCKARTNAVLGDGNYKTKIMFIGEGPGEQEDLTGLAFVGKAGKLLDKMLASITLDRSKVYICNVVKCRPPGNRNPEDEEINACLEYLRHQYLIIKPRLIVLLGSIACKALLSKDFSITRQHGQVIDKKGVHFLPTFHPSALLRDESKKPLAWEDFKIIMKLIESENLLNI